MKIKIKSNERVYICGQTGSGKSVLFKTIILPQIQNYVIYDYKEEINIEGAEIFTAPEDFLSKKNRPAIIYRPKTGQDEEFDILCKQVFYRGNNVLVLDEMANHVTATKILPYHDMILRLGRSRGVGNINITQRPRYTHNNIISQTEHFFMFYLNQLTDRRKMAEILGEDVLKKIPKYYFWYYTPEMDRPVLCKPVKI